MKKLNLEPHNDEILQCSNAQMKFICHVMVLVEIFSIGYYNIKSNCKIESYTLQMLASRAGGGVVIHLTVLKPIIQLFFYPPSEV